MAAFDLWRIDVRMTALLRNGSEKALAAGDNREYVCFFLAIAAIVVVVGENRPGSVAGAIFFRQSS